MLKYPVKLTPDTNDTLLVTFPDVPEAVTFGDTREEALSLAVDALESMIMAKMDDKEEIPLPSKCLGKDFVVLSLVSSAKIMLYNAFLKSGVTKSGLARLMGCHPPQIERLFDLNHESKMAQIEKAFSVLGFSINMNIRKAA